MAKKTETNLSMSDMTKIVLQDTLKNFYLFYGNENYLKSFFANKICERTGVGKESVIKLDGKIKAGDLEEALDSSPLFSDKTVVVVKNTCAFKASGKGDYDYSFLRELSEDSYCIFIEEEADKRSSNYRLLEEIGIILECNEQPQSDVLKILTRKAQQNGRSIDPKAVALLYDGLGKDIYTLLNEVDKLSLLVNEGEQITEAVVKSATELSTEAKTYEFTDAIAEKNGEKAQKCLNSMLADRLPEQIIISAIAKHFSSLYTISGLLEERFTNREIGEKLKMFDFLVSKYAKQSKQFSKATIADIIDYISDIDYRSKNGLVDIGLGIEMIIQYVCGN